jgi:hypothetical protein
MQKIRRHLVNVFDLSRRDRAASGDFCHRGRWAKKRSACRLLLPAMTTQLMMSVPPLSFNRHLFNDNRPRLDERQSLRVVMPGSEKNRANNGREDQCFF